MSTDQPTDDPIPALAEPASPPLAGENTRGGHQPEGRTPKAKGRRPKGEGGLTVRPSGCVQMTHTWRDDFGCTHTKTFHGSPKRRKEDKKHWTLEECAIADAQRKKDAYIKKLTAGHVEGDEKTFKWLRIYLLGAEDEPGYFEKQGRRTKGKNTLKDDRDRAERFLSRLDPLKLSQIKTRHIDTVLLDIKNEIPGDERLRTVDLTRSLAGLLLKEANRQGYVQGENPAQNALRFEYKPAKVRIYNLMQVLSLMEQATIEIALAKDQSSRIMSTYDCAWVALGALAGCRKSEIAGLLLTDYEAETQRLTIHRQHHREDTKSAHGRRTIYIAEFGAQAIERAIAVRSTNPFAASSIFLFPSVREAGKAVHPSTVHHRVTDLMERAGLPKIKVHELRHTANQLLREENVDGATRAKTLGHGKEVNEAVYTHAQDAEVFDAGKRIEQRVRAAIEEEERKKAEAAD